MILEAALFWYGWNAGKGEKYLKAAIGGGRLAFIAFAFICAIKGLVGFMYPLSLGPGFIPNLVEMVIYAVLAYCYCKNAKEAGETFGVTP